MGIFSTPTDADPLPPSAAVYGRLMLSIYDLYVLSISNRFAWRCPTPRILNLYNQSISARHLDIGVGTGYYLDRVRFPSDQPTVHLMDINPLALARAAHRIRRYQPRCIQEDVTDAEITLEESYDSIAVNYLLHCLSGVLPDKGGQLLEQVLPFLSPSGGRLFGATILGQGVKHNALGQRLMTVYNRKGIFGNRSDSEEQLHTLFETHFDHYKLEIHGCVALFAGYR